VVFLSDAAGAAAGAAIEGKTPVEVESVEGAEGVSGIMVQQDRAAGGKQLVSSWRFMWIGATRNRASLVSSILRHVCNLLARP
jgi:hypothetical protein